MTTIVTVATAGHPAAVTIGGHSQHYSPELQSYGRSSTTHFVPSNTSRDFTISSGASFSLAELPVDATGLPEQPQLAGAAD